MSKATRTYLHALNDMRPTDKPGLLARMADRMSGDAFDKRDWGGMNAPSCDDMMDIETAIFTALCRANGIDWRTINPPE